MSPPPEDSDHRLLARIRRGDEPAFEQLYRRFKGRVLQLACRFGADRSLAQDVLQEFFRRFLDGLESFELKARFSTYLYPVVKNITREQLRRARREPALDADLEAGLPAPEPGAAASAADDLRAALAILSAEAREILILRYTDGLSLQEIAETLGRPLGTIKSRLHAALTALRADPRLAEWVDWDD